jgi:hypothetical protein
LAKSTDVEFDEFVRRHQASVAANIAARGPIDWNKQRDEWLRYLEGLYDQVKDFLRSHIVNGAIRLEFRKIKITEDDIGTYEADKMILYIGDQTITFTPVGTLLIGSKGRVDVEGSAGRSRIALLNKSAKSANDVIKVTIIDPGAPEPITKPKTEKPIEWAWKIVTPPPATAFIDLNKESLLQLILEVSNG